MVSCQKGPTRHAYAWQIGPFWQDTRDLLIQENAFLKIFAKCQPFCLHYNELIGIAVKSKEGYPYDFMKLS